MTKEDIHLGDWQRLLFGDTPGVFAWEVVVRTLLIYLFFLGIMRLLGKRMSAQLTITELGVMIMLGGIVSVGMQIPNRGLLPVALLLLCVLLFQRGLNWLALKSRRVEVTLQGDLTLLVKDGVIQVEQLRAESVSHNELYAQLRDQKIRQLGEVQRLYLEGDGNFSVFKNETPPPGLSVFPAKDQRILEILATSDEQKVCLYCGHLAQPHAHNGKQCPNCSHDEWTTAVQ
ncbi:DUF421 domain-containing protein [Hymenobacter norwichensis]|uniref:DUF421 domain-containing protein n=1 Tax=Hymenobacter norwichensis TaxID=223903 RepID=UPI0003B7A9CC|nr:YetF domain-containing protein [Hymenobacter norwichensis]